MVKLQDLSFHAGGADGLQNTIGLVGSLEEGLRNLLGTLKRVKTTVKTVTKEAGKSLAAFDTLEKLNSASTTTTVTTEKTAYKEDADALMQAARSVAQVLGEAVKSFAARVQEKLQSFAAWSDGGITAGLLTIISAVGAVQALLSGDTSVALWLGALGTAFGIVGDEVNTLRNLLLLNLVPAFLSIAAGGGVFHTISGAVGALSAAVLLLGGAFQKVSAVAAQVLGTVKALWGGVADWFQKALITPLGSKVKAGINGVIGMLNGLIGVFVWAINGVISLLNKLSVKVPDWVPGFGGKTFGFQIKTLQAPQIPYLAKGAVLPANRPFLAMVGDQKHGTNVEAPLTTIQDAVSLVMGEQTNAIMAGFEASITVQKEILEAVLGIHIGDSAIAQAVQRYEKKLSAIRGGTL